MHARWRVKLWFNNKKECWMTNLQCSLYAYIRTWACAYVQKKNTTPASTCTTYKAALPRIPSPKAQSRARISQKLPLGEQVTQYWYFLFILPLRKHAIHTLWYICILAKQRIKLSSCWRRKPRWNRQMTDSRYHGSVRICIYIRMYIYIYIYIYIY